MSKTSTNVESFFELCIQAYVWLLVFEKESKPKSLSNCEREIRRNVDQANRKVCMHSITVYCTAVAANTATVVVAAAAAAADAGSSFFCIAYMFSF